MHNRTVPPENTNGRVRLGNPVKYTPTNQGDSCSNLVFSHKLFERMLPQESSCPQSELVWQRTVCGDGFRYKDTEYVFALYKVGVQLDATFLVTCGGIHVHSNIINKNTHLQIHNKFISFFARRHTAMGLVEVTGLFRTLSGKSTCCTSVDHV